MMAPGAVDLHTHFVAPDLVRFLEREGATYQTRILQDDDGRRWFLIKERARRPLGPRLTDVDHRAREMDALGIGAQALSCPPFALYPEVEAGAGLAVAQLANDTVARAAASVAGRFVGVATVPLQAPTLAATELERAVRTLGLRAVQIPTSVGEVTLDDPSLRPFWEAAAALGVPVLLHPFDAAPQGALGRYYLGNLLGNPMDTALAAALLVYGGVLERCPTLRVVLYHGGGAFPAALGRLDHGYRVRPECRGALPRPPSSYVGQFFFDCITHDREALASLVARFSPEKVLLGSDYPFDMGLEDPVGAVAALGLPAEATTQILRANAAALLRV